MHNLLAVKIKKQIAKEAIEEDTTLSNIFRILLGNFVTSVQKAMIFRHFSVFFKQKNNQFDKKFEQTANKGEVIYAK